MEEERSDRQICRVCGATIQPGDRFCPNCGSPRDASTGASSSETTPETETIPLPAVPPPPVFSQSTSEFPPPPPRDWASAAPPAQSGGNRRTWWIIGGLFALILIVCCCCACLVLVVASSDSALQEDLEGTAAILGVAASAAAVQFRR